MTTPGHLEALHDTARSEALVADSGQHPLLIFKHSVTCGTSMSAYEELEQYLASADARVRHALVTVQTSRQVSDHVAVRLGVRHQSPQAILVRSGEVVWTASHHRITADALTVAVRSALATMEPTIS